MHVSWSVAGFLSFVLIGCGGTGAVPKGTVDGGPSASAGPADAGGIETGAPNTPARCTSMTTWSRGDRGSSLMHPGMACISCHSSGEGPYYTAAGTVYPTTHEPDDCNGTSNVTVIITDAAGNTFTTMPNSAGNFYFSSSFQFPITAKVTGNGKTREMLTPQKTGDCNSCHTQSGTQAAPGRIVAP